MILISDLVLVSPSVILLQLIEIARRLFGSYSPTHEPFLGKLADKTYEYVTYDLNAGNTYAIIGVCDENCSDVDLKLYDWNYNLIAQDNKLNDFPLLTVDVYRTRRFRLRVIMSDCQTYSCDYGIAVFRQ